MTSSRHHLIPKAVISQHYGQVRTLIDLAKALNAEKQYTSREAFEADFHQLVNQYGQNGLINPYSLSVFCDTWLRPSMEQNRPLEIDENRIYEYLLDDNSIPAVLEKRGLSKLLRIIYYLNESQRYTSALQIQNDLHKVFSAENLQRNHLASLNDASASIIWYPAAIVFQTLLDKWELLKDCSGVLSNHKIEEYFISDFEHKLQKYGLRGTIACFYERDTPCHPDVFVPLEYGRAPFFVEKQDDVCHVTYVKSCGEGIGPNAYPDAYEFNLVREVILQSGKYENIGKVFLPIDDFSLPIYNTNFPWSSGKFLLASPEAKRNFIHHLRPAAKVDLDTCWSAEIDNSYPWK